LGIQRTTPTSIARNSACVVHLQATIAPNLCQAVVKNIFAVKMAITFDHEGFPSHGRRSAALASLATQIPKLLLKISRSRF